MLDLTGQGHLFNFLLATCQDKKCHGLRPSRTSVKRSGRYIFLTLLSCRYPISAGLTAKLLYAEGMAAFPAGKSPAGKSTVPAFVCLGQAQRAVKNFPTAHFVRHEGRHENRLIMLFTVRPARQKIVMALRPYYYMPQAWQPFLRGSPPQENPPSAFRLCVSVANKLFLLRTAQTRQGNTADKSPCPGQWPDHS